MIPVTLAPSRTRLPAGFWIACAVLLGFPALQLYWTALAQPPGRTIGEIIRTSIEAAAFLWAFRRRDLPRGFRTFLLGMGLLSVSSVLSYVIEWIQTLAHVTLLPLAVDHAWVLASYVAGLAITFAHPMVPLRGRRAVSFVLDTIIVAGGLGALLWVLVTVPLARSGTSLAHRLEVLGLAQIPTLVACNMLAVRGYAIPNGRAFWNLVAGQALYIPMLLLVSYSDSQSGVSPALTNLCYYGGVLFTLAGAVEVRRAPWNGVLARPEPRGTVDFNPVALATPVLAIAALGGALLRGPGELVIPLSAILISITLMLLVRLLLSLDELNRLARADAERERRAGVERMAAVRQLAGGIAHEFNNLMTVVIGGSELGQMDADNASASRVAFSQIRTAGERAAQLTRQLLLYSGGQPDLRRDMDLTAAMRGVLVDVARAAPPPIVLEVTLSEALLVHADDAQVRQAVLELVRNSARAMPDGGTLSVGLALVSLAEHPPTTILAAPPGAYAAIEVADTGVGVAPDEIRRVFEPFYSGLSPAEATGLGLSAVIGIMGQHRGGLEFESAPGRGTRVRLLFPRVASVPVPARQGASLESPAC